MILEENYTLSNGVEIPKLGLGTWFISDQDVVQAVKDAAEIGYRHIDTAQAYQNERGVGEGIRAAGVNRDDLFITTKLAAEVKSYQQAVSSIDQSLRTMGLDYIDMMIIHSPQPWRQFGEDDRYFEGNREAWRALEQAYKAGKLRAIGVSNFEKADLDNILESSSVSPMVNQILVHISNTPHELIQHTQDKGILVEAYSPVAHGELLKNQGVAEIARAYGVTIPQLGIRYVLQLGLLALPKTANPEHMKNNADVDFVISDADMDRLKNVPQIENYGEASMFPVYGGS
ncbi:MAG TPA: aldo/keto reductase [Aggregatilinea sp.]|uniref:aldo/keto reductase n=1 Tax=Aggregatilinea sp. TaxID=2806333 RepID=UPI002BCBCC0F|nr:aldo/keto reductase [Aggregatilinea sp.]HML22440.1 aldo/keto reductase [Aggregatilinea sp.]